MPSFCKCRRCPAALSKRTCESTKFTKLCFDAFNTFTLSVSAARYVRNCRGTRQPRFRVSGSDLKASIVTDRLQRMGVEIFEGHASENVGQPHVVVRSTAVRDDNPEVVEANHRSIPVIPRAEMLAELMRLKPHTVAVAGSHGKTTTTSMVATVLGHAGLDPTMVVGGVVGAFGSNAHLGTSDLMVVEADESDRSFLMLTPTIASSQTSIVSTWIITTTWMTFELAS